MWAYKKESSIIIKKSDKETALIINGILDSHVANNFLKERQYKYLLDFADCRHWHLYTLP